MNLLIRAANVYTPTLLKRKKLLELFACTAGGFECEMPSVQGLPYDELLRSYARFTAAQANQALCLSGCHAERVFHSRSIAANDQRSISVWESPSGDLSEIQRRLYDGAYRIGCDLRRTFRITNTVDALAAARVLYRALGIDLTATPAGEITVHRCFFSEFYSIQVCQLIASLDEGLFAGLSGGGRLAFNQRITEGRECCKASLRLYPGEDTIP
jgi:hypothetical protein